jgi:hypothetical protein
MLRIRNIMLATLEQERTMRNLIVMVLGVALYATNALAEPVDVVVRIDPSRGVDPSVDYARLLEHGPWDDRNYTLTAADLAWLPEDDRRHTDPVPAFYRIELRRRWQLDLRAEGKHYPRRAFNQFVLEAKGFLIDGAYHRDVRRRPDGRFDVHVSALPERGEGDWDWPKFLSGEVRLSTPTGAAESAIAINPINPDIVIAGTNGPTRPQTMWRSSNGGETWTLGGTLPGNECCDPTVGWSSDGSIAYTASLIDGVPFYRSTDNGATWTLVTELSGGGSDKEYLHVDLAPASPHQDNIYLCWHDGNEQKFARSTDLGLSFGSVLTIDSGSFGIGCDLTSDSTGTVYYAYPRTSNGGNIRLVSSTNGGASFGSGVTVADTLGNFDFPLPSMETRNVFIYVSADTDRSNGPFKDSLYLSWTDNTNADSSNPANNHGRVQVAFRRAGGSSFTITNPHPTADSNTVDRYQQWLRVDEQGRVHIIFYDTRHSTNRTGVDLYYNVSTDGAQSWGEPIRITAVTSPNATDGFEWGDYQGLDLLLDDVIAIYTDNRNESGGAGQSIDVYAAAGFNGPGDNLFANGFE